MENENLAWHEKPVWASDFFIRLDLDKSGMPNRYEQLWVKNLDVKTCVVCCIPFFAYGVSLGDMVSIDNEFNFVSIIEKGNYETARIAVRPDCNTGHINQQVSQWIYENKYLCEWYSNGYVAIAIEKDRLQDIHYGKIEVLIENDIINFEISSVQD